MKSDIILARDVAKSFRIEHSPVNTLKRRLLSVINPEMRSRTEIFNALRGVSFSLGQGESLALLGNNGSGKSTLLRILAKILTPTTGSVEINGRVAPMIELGVGFHPDLTGEENIFLNASMYGLSNQHTRRILNTIIDFSGLDGFIDAPIKTYSSGMYMRLGFAVAAHTSPDLMLIDEVLAVGDAGFQEKCFSRIRQLQDEGMSLILVSHDEALSRRFCQKFLRLSHGHVVESGPFPTGS